jgi:hypothetical protein
MFSYSYRTGCFPECFHMHNADLCYRELHFSVIRNRRAVNPAGQTVSFCTVAAPSLLPCPSVMDVATSQNSKSLIKGSQLCNVFPAMKFIIYISYISFSLYATVGPASVVGIAIC